MSWLNVGVNLVLVLPLFWINGFLGKWKLHASNVFEYSVFGFDEISERNYSENFFQMIVHPPVYLALVCGILQCFSCYDIIQNLWLLVPFYWVLRVVHAIFYDTFVFINWRIQILTSFVSVALGKITLFGVILPLIQKQESILISVEAFRDAFWYAVLVYIAKLIWDAVKGRIVGKKVFPQEKKTGVIIRRYNRYRKKYNRYINDVIKEKYPFKSVKYKKHFECLLYAIMIYETHNRPLWMRVLEYSVKILCPRRTMSLGVMQVQSREWIGNRKSISRAIEKLYHVFSAAELTEKLQMSILDYNPSSDYYEQVSAIYDVIRLHIELPNLCQNYVKVRKCLVCAKEARK